MRKAHALTIERAARLLDALGLELHVRRKGEITDSRALRLAIDELRNPRYYRGLHEETAAVATIFLAERYAHYALDPLQAAKPDQLFRTLMLSA